MRIFLLFFLVVIFPACVHSQSNLNISKVTVNPTPNYEGMRGGKGGEKLSDGHIATGSLFWLDPNTLGWQREGRITIDLELAESANISSIALNTAKNEQADVLYPFNVNVFFSLDGNSFFYVGDIATQQENKTGGYKTLELKKDNINQNAKFVKLIVIPQGRMFFTDEIRLFGSKKAFMRTRPSQLSQSQIEEIVVDNKTTVINRNQLLNQLAQVPSDDKQSWEQLKKEIIGSKDLTSHTSVQNFRQKIAQLNIGFAKKEAISMYFLTGGDDRGLVNNAVNTSFNRSFEIVNNQSKKITLPLTVKENGTTKSVLYEVQPIQTRNSRTVYDVLVPLTPGSVTVLSPGERKRFMISTRSAKQGTSNIEVAFGEQNLTYQVQSLNLGIDHAFRNRTDLQVNVWPYYSTPFYKGREQAVKTDLRNHYVNIFTIPAWTLEPLNPKTDHQKLKDYLKLYSPGDKVLLFLNHSSYMSNPGDYLQGSWKRRYLAWHDKIMTIFKDHGISTANIYLYPFDEVEEKEIESFNTFSTWIKEARPSSQIYLTVVEQNNLAKVQSQADVIQLLVTKNKITKVKPTPGQDYWIYDIMDDSKETDPQIRYRAMAWNAYRANATGIGFWNYADMFGESVWDDFDGSKSDYNVVYDKESTILSSIRWEAFKQGIEEYLILKKHEEKFGRSATLKIIGTSIPSSRNLENQMDAFREEVLKQLQ